MSHQQIASNKLNMSPPKHPKSGPRKLQKGDTEKFDRGYDNIKWSKPPVCDLCQGKSKPGDCPICH